MELRDYTVLGIDIYYTGPEDPDEEMETYCGFEIDDSYVELYNSSWCFSYEGNDIFVREGVWFEKNDEGEFEPDWSLSWFYLDEDNPKEYLYFESDGPEVSIYNFIRTMERIENPNLKEIL